jgi:hypothetical protein
MRTEFWLEDLKGRDHLDGFDVDGKMFKGILLA